jgi:hypothetical protein
MTKNTAAQNLGALGGKASAARLTAQQKKDRARKAAIARWKNKKKV